MSQACLQFSLDFPVPDAQVGWVREVIELIENATPGEELVDGDPLFTIFPDWNEWGEAGFDISFNPHTGHCNLCSD